MPRVTISQKDQKSGGAASEIAITSLQSRVICALKTGSVRLKVIVWDVNMDGELTRLGEALDEKVSQVAITDWPQGPGVVTAVRTKSENLKVISWKVAADGSIAQSDSKSAGKIKEV